MKRNVNLTVNISLLFDQLQDMKGDTTALGERLVSALLCEPSAMKRVGLAFYG